MKEKLTELIKQAKYCTAEELAEYLIAAGLVLPVRCEECKHFVWDEWDGSWCCIKNGRYVKKDFWCKHGERKDNERKAD